MDDAFAPMGFKDESGEITGFDVDLAKELGKRLNKEIVFQPIDWTMKESELKAGNIDFIWNGYTITNERKNKVDFSVPYLKNKQVIVTLSDSSINSKSDLYGKKVGARSRSRQLLLQWKKKRIYIITLLEEVLLLLKIIIKALMDLEAGRIDAVVADEILVRYYISLKDEDKFKKYCLITLVKKNMVLVLEKVIQKW